MSRRGFLLSGGAAALSYLAGSNSGFGAAFPISTAEGPPDYTLELTEVEWEIAPRKKIHTSAYNGQIPGKLIRLKEGKPVTIDVINRLDHPEIVHWHGMWIPPDVDGSMEEGTPMIDPGGRARIQFTPMPSGLHWYHTHVAAERKLNRGLYTGLFGPLLVEGQDDPGRYDAEHFLVLHEWDPYIQSSDDGSQEIGYNWGTINGRMLGSGDPIQVRQGQRVLFQILNASATLVHWLALPGHTFEVLALDGRPVPKRAKVKTLRLGPAERVTAVVTMDQPGIWILGETSPKRRNTGLGVAIEYAGQTGSPRWVDPDATDWDYRKFGKISEAGLEPEIRIPLVFQSKFQGHGAMDRWQINGKSFPHTDPILLRQGLRHRLIFENRSKDDHPVHLHRHAFELVSIEGRPTRGVFKDVVMVEAGTTVEADLLANHPGPSLFHCHQQDHMDMGFMALFHYA